MYQFLNTTVFTNQYRCIILLLSQERASKTSILLCMVPLSFFFFFRIHSCKNVDKSYHCRTTVQHSFTGSSTTLQLHSSLQNTSAHWLLIAQKVMFKSSSLIGSTQFTGSLLCSANVVCAGHTSGVTVWVTEHLFSLGASICLRDKSAVPPFLAGRRNVALPTADGAFKLNLLWTSVFL